MTMTDDWTLTSDEVEVDIDISDLPDWAKEAAKNGNIAVIDKAELEALQAKATVGFEIEELRQEIDRLKSDD